MEPIRTITGACEITTGAFESTSKPPVYQGENGAIQLSIAITKSGEPYSLPPNAQARYYVFFDARKQMTPQSEMTIADDTISAVIGSEHTLLSGSPEIVILLLDEVGSLITTCKIPVRIIETRAKTVIYEAPPPAGVTIYVDRTAYIGENNNWFVWDADTATYFDSGKEAVPQNAYIGENGNWWEWDEVNRQYADSGVHAEGPQGVKGDSGSTFTPAVSAEGVISWTNDGGLVNPADRNITGPEGTPGQAATIQIIESITTEVGTGYVFIEADDSTEVNRRYIFHGEAPGGFRPLARFDTLAELEAAHPTGNAGDQYLVGQPENAVLYIWDVAAGAWTGGITMGGGGAALPDGAPGQVLYYDQAEGEESGQWVGRTLDAADVGAVSLDTLKKLVVDIAYPVGRIFSTMSADDDPNVLYPGTAWERWAQGKVPVGADESDPDFDTPGKTGGEKSTTHGHDVAITKGGGGNTGGTALTLAQLPNAAGNVSVHGSATGSMLYTATGVFAGSTVLTGQYKTITPTAGASSLQNIYFSLGGGGGKHVHALEEHDHEGAVDDANISNMQPYITCYMWLRTA